MIEIKDKSKCCGCSACVNACPKKCIDMKEDKEGFLYPLVDKKLCIDCNICEKKCPVLNVQSEKKTNQDGYIIQIKDEKVRRESTSGGAFSAIAKYIIRNNGVVFGASYNDKLEVCHDYVETEEELGRFRNSKYVQSIIGNSYIQAKYFLDSGKIVCFSGTPCQIEGLIKYLGKEYKNLITVDVVCHGVPSPLVWRKYLSVQKSKYGKDIKNIMFRDKYYGYKYSTMTIKNSSNKDIYHMGVESDLMLRAFFNEICQRPSCHKCMFKKRYRESDFTIWDCFNVGTFSKKMDDDKGTTKMLVNSEKGRSLFKNINEYINFERVDSDKLVYGVKELTESVKPSKLREEFMNDLNLLDSKDLFEKYFPDNIQSRFERYVRILCCKLRIYQISKKIYLRIKK